MKKKVLKLLLTACMVIPTVAVTVGSNTVFAAEEIEEAETIVTADGEEEEPLVREEADGFYYSINTEHSPVACIEGYYGDSTDVVIPETLDGIKVTEIYNEAFKDCDTITSITIPNSVTTIGKSAFYGCDKLTKVVLPDDLKEISEYLFGSCANLTEVNIPDTVIKIDNFAFIDCVSLEKVTLPEKLSTINAYSFSNTAIKEIRIPGNVTNIGERAFSDCKKLKDLTIEEGVSTIDIFAFENCSSLTEVIIPKSVTEINEGVFENCNRLNNITILNKNCKLITGMLYTVCSSDVIIYAPKGSKAQEYAEEQGNPFYTLEEKEMRKNVESFVKRMYTNVLGREADEEGLETWTTGLLDKTYQGVDIAYGFMMSSEFQNKAMTDREYLNILYNTFFNRAADEAGLNTWLTLLGQGSSKAYVLSGFVNSKEFATLCTSFGIERGTMNDDGTVAREGVEGFVDRLYSKVMGRTPDASGSQMWAEQITSGKMSAETVAKSFFDSVEYINKNTSNEQFVLTLYETFMGRSADEAGKNMWLDQLNGKMSRTQVLEGFSRSDEFKAILASYGL